MIIIAYRQRGAYVWSHHFRVEPRNWRRFYSLARLYRHSREYAYLRNGGYVAVL